MIESFKTLKSAKAYETIPGQPSLFTARMQLNQSD